MPLFGMLIFLVLFCGGLIYGIYRLLGKQATQAADRFASLSEEIENKKSEVKKMIRDAELNAGRLTAAAQNECEKLKSQTMEENQQLRLNAVKEARTEAERIVNDAIKARDGIRIELEGQLHVRAVDSACDLVLNVFPEALRLDIHRYWLNELLDHGLEALDRFDSREKIKEISVESAFPLSEEERAKILSCVEKKVKLELQLKEQVDSRLVGGLRLKLGHLVLEASLISNLTEAARHAKNPVG